ncbi:hypothetical protein MFFC18_50890 [Mariniblastus fucicola]|uniref:Uncharacterized protein n=1 Tax=Mariniblastus fucicola TaxID=980251 RepID=A0A5B9PIQ9_9BACT|nr:hypothetical protein MFFC18_50890 [Mariniblastus fucicola]
MRIFKYSASVSFANPDLQQTLDCQFDFVWQLLPIPDDLPQDWIRLIGLLCICCAAFSNTNFYGVFRAMSSDC